MRRRLVERREEQGLSREALAHKMDANVKTVQRWEAGTRTPQMAQRVDLAAALDWSMAQLALALSDDESGPLNGHAVPSWLGHFASLEQGAAELRAFEPIVAPGLLQTEDYACVVEGVAPDQPGAAEVARRVAQRMRRQQVLNKPDPLRLFALLDASVLQRTTGGPEVMEHQLTHLQQMANRPNVEIRVLPLDERAHPAGRGSFSLLTSPDSGLPFIATSEDLTGVTYHDHPATVATYLNLWDQLWSVSDELAKVQLQRQ